MRNYDSVASEGMSIRGSGQAGYLGRHTQSTFGIVTTPRGGTPTKEDFFKVRMFYRNTGKYLKVFHQKLLLLKKVWL